MTASASTTPPKKTPLFERHSGLGAKLIDFGGWMMPVNYPGGILEEHHAVRTAMGLFDVSHMGEIYFSGEGAGAAVQRLVTNDVSKLVDGAAQYTCTCREHGGIVDDCIVYRTDAEHYLIIVNASNIAKDHAHFVEHAGSLCEIVDRSDECALLAVQGPKAVALVTELTGGGGVPERPFRFQTAQVGDLGIAVTVARTGYTGEDGVELLVAAGEAARLWDFLLERGKAGGLRPIGLGARDTLRLEARLCLYGNDIDEEHDPFEAGLAWVVKGKGYVGEAAHARQRSDVKRQLIGFKIEGRGIARHGYPIRDDKDAEIGVVTSGTVAPTVGGAIGMGYVPSALAAPGTRLVVDCRGKPAVATVVKGPFYSRPKDTRP